MSRVIAAWILLVAFGTLFVVSTMAMLVVPRLLEQGRPVPGWDTVVVGPEIVDERDVADVLSLFLTEWGRRFGRHATVSVALNALTIRLVDADVIEVRGVLASAVLDSPRHIRIAARRRTWRAALAHECIHVALWATTGDPDRDIDHASDEMSSTWTDAHRDLGAYLHARLAPPNGALPPPNPRYQTWKP